MRRTLTALAMAATLSSFAGTANAAYMMYSGVDLNPNNPNPLVNVPNSAAAEAVFLSKLKPGVSTENFESLTVGTGAPLTLSFASGTAGDSVKATLSGGQGVVATSDLQGRYSIPSATSSQFWLVDATSGNDTFTVTFDRNIAAFGFYGTDVGDFSGLLWIELLSAAGTVLDTLAVPSSNTDASALYFGVTAGAPADDFRSIRFVAALTDPTSGAFDTFGFDNFTVATRAQLPDDNGGPPGVPLPGTIALLGAGLAALGMSRRNRRTN